MFRKKEFIVSLCSVIIICGAVFAFSIGYKSKATNIDNLEEVNQAENLEIYQKLTQELSENEYGGGYIDDEGFLNVNIVGNNAQKAKELTKGKQVKYHTVKYSLSDLKEIINTLNTKYYQLGIKRIELDEKNNKVNVYLDSLEESKINSIKNIVDSEAVEIKKIESEIKLDFID